jgi:tight adherence protein B
MEQGSSDLLFWIIPALHMMCFAGLSYSFLRALSAGAESYASIYTEQASRQFEDMFLFIPPRRILEIAWTLAITVFLVFFFIAGNFSSLGGFSRGLLLGCAAGAAALGAPKRALALMRKRRLQRFNEQLVDALMTMSNALRSGSSILQAFEHIVRQNLNPISLEFGHFLQQTRVGVKFEDALSNLDKRVDSEDLTLMISAIEIARQTGGNLTEVFERISATIRERIRIRGRIQMLTAQGRMQGIVVGAMPILLALAMFALDPAMMAGFVRSVPGIMTVGVVGILETIGILIIRKIINIDI